MEPGVRFNSPMQPTRTPCAELRDKLLRAYAPCPHFCDTCKGIAKWEPREGYAPRGFVGALGSLDEVDLVLVAAEPGEPFPRETYDETDPDFVDRCAEQAYGAFAGKARRFHENIRWILDQCFPDLDFPHQMCKTWITDAYLCSAPTVTGDVPARSWRTCAGDYLHPQLEPLKDRAIVALGEKAETRIGRAFEVLRVSAAGRPEGNKPRARESWKKIPPYLEASLVRRRAASPGS